jgi:DNA-binding transcriptional MerR regulator
MSLENPKIDKKRSIGEVAEILGVETHVIRFWESKFPQIKPEIGKGARRYYFDKDLAILTKIKTMLYEEGYTITGLQNLLKKRKKNDSKEQNIQFLLDNDQDLSDSSQKINLSPENNAQITNLIKRVEFNLDRLEKLVEEI